jgi:hypothetical protein
VGSQELSHTLLLSAPKKRKRDPRFPKVQADAVNVQVVCEGGLVTEAVKANMVDQLEVLLKAGAKTVVRHGRCAPQALHMACYYDHDPKIIKLLCRYGKPVTVIFTVTMASCLEALKFVHNLETSKRLQLLLQYYYCKFMLHDFKYIFFGRHKIYLFVKAFVREQC